MLGRIIKWETQEDALNVFNPNNFNGLVENHHREWFGFTTVSIIQAGYQNEDICVGGWLEFDQGPKRVGARDLKSAINIRILK